MWLWLALHSPSTTIKFHTERRVPPHSEEGAAWRRMLPPRLCAPLQGIVGVTTVTSVAASTVCRCSPISAQAITCSRHEYEHTHSDDESASVFTSTQPLLQPLIMRMKWTVSTPFRHSRPVCVNLRFVSRPSLGCSGVSSSVSHLFR